MSSTVLCDSQLNDVQLARLRRRCLRVALIAQTVSGVGAVAGVTVGALLARQMTLDERFSGMPAAAYMIG